MSAIDKVVTVFKLLGLSLFIIFLVGCAGKALTYKGSWVAEQDRIALRVGGPHKGYWQTRDMGIEYTYQQETQNLQISGGIALGNYLTTGFSTLEHLRLDIIALDADGMVLNSEFIRTFGYRRSIDFIGNMPFKKQMLLPADTAAIAFGYRGKVTDGGGGILGSREGDRIHWDFWKVPGRRPSG